MALMRYHENWWYFNMLPLRWPQISLNFIPVYHLCKSLLKIYLGLFVDFSIAYRASADIWRPHFTATVIYSCAQVLPTSTQHPLLRISVVMSLQDVVNQYFLVASNFKTYPLFLMFIALYWDLNFYLELIISSPNRRWREDQLHCLVFLCVCEYCS